MICEEPRVPGLPGVGDVTDGSVDYYDMDWPVAENGASEEEMQKCAASPCGTSACTGNSPEQTDSEEYEIVTE